jgi:hypothetical protein
MKRWGCAMTVSSEVMSITMMAMALTGPYWAIKVDKKQGSMLG